MKEIIDLLVSRKNGEYLHLPDKLKAGKFLKKILNILYHNNRINEKHELYVEFKKLEKLFNELISNSQFDNKENNLWSDFRHELKDIYLRTMLDAEAILDFDPAAESLEEVIQAYPGFYAIAIHRISHFFYLNKQSLLARIFSEIAHEKTGIDIHPGANIGNSFAIDHGTGIVIGETTEIGDRVKIYQGVTLGAMSVSKKLASKKRHPTIEDDVIIYGNATILGGDTIIGKNSIIGGNVWLTDSVPENSIVQHKSEIKIRINE